MKKIKNLKNVVALNKEQQKEINGGYPAISCYERFGNYTGQDCLGDIPPECRSEIC